MIGHADRYFLALGADFDDAATFGSTDAFDSAAPVGARRPFRTAGT